MPTPKPGDVVFRIRVQGANRQPGDRPHAVELLLGDVEQADGSAKRLVRIVDRRGNRYRERLSDPLTGEVLQETDEPLSEHWGHGSAKRA